MAIKIYLHFDGPPQFTKVFRLTVDSLFDPVELLQGFADAYAKKFPDKSPLDCRALTVKPFGGGELGSQATLLVKKDLETDYIVLDTSTLARLKLCPASAL